MNKKELYKQLEKDLNDYVYLGCITKEEQNECLEDCKNWLKTAQNRNVYFATEINTGYKLDLTHNAEEEMEL